MKLAPGTVLFGCEGFFSVRQCDGLIWVAN